MNIKNKILTVCHDAGGAEVVSAYVKKNSGECQFICLVSGPAVNIFNRKGIQSHQILKEGLGAAEKILADYRDVGCLLTGTSWASSVEIDFICVAKRKGLRTVVFLDHWVNYRERFGYPRKNWKENLPNEIWVGDKHALRLAKKKFDGMVVKYVPNPYFSEIRKEYERARESQKSGGGLLFVSEPLNSDINCFGDKRKKVVSEEKILENILEELKRLQFNNKIIVRLHPSENKDKYNKLLDKYKTELTIEKSNKKNAFKDLARVTTVLGMSSMFLVVANLCGKKVISYMPGKSNIKFVLPKEKIIIIKKLGDIKKLLCSKLLNNLNG